MSKKKARDPRKAGYLMRKGTATLDWDMPRGYLSDAT